MSKRILITGGAGFLGSHLADELLEQGYAVRVLDCLLPTVHPSGPPDYLHPEIELIVGDIRDFATVKPALEGVDVVYHCAAAVGGEPSMRQSARYTSINTVGTATLFEALAEQPVERVIVASCMSIYGEGTYAKPGGLPYPVRERTPEQLQRGQWDLYAEDGTRLEPCPTPETKVAAALSVYALSKYSQEQLTLLLGKTYKIPTVALRLFNLYGPRQSLANPYAGALIQFAAHCLYGQRPRIYEDGNQKRDFVNVRDAALACRLAMENPQAMGEIFNVGSGQSVTIRHAAEEVCRVLTCKDLRPNVSRRYRVGDVRHCFADISKAKRLLGYRPRISLARGLTELAEWLERRSSVNLDVGK